MQMKQWNEKDRELWKLKMQLEMFKLIKSKGGTMREEIEGNKLQNQMNPEQQQHRQGKGEPKKVEAQQTTGSDPGFTKNGTMKVGKKAMASRSGLSTPWDAAIPFTSDGKVIPAEKKLDLPERAKEHVCQKVDVDLQEALNPLKLLEKSRGDGYETSNKSAYGAFYNVSLYVP